MIIRCISSEPSEEQARKLGVGKNYFPGRQEFGLIIGEDYLVFGLTMVDGEPWADILLSPVDYLHSVPLCLFEIIDKRVSKYWEIGLGPKGNLIIRPSSILNQPYYFDDLSNSVPDVVDDFQRLRGLLDAENQL
jgi:hypothetical protein